jgi:pre-mRNA-splicing factor SYF1
LKNTTFLKKLLKYNFFLFKNKIKNKLKKIKVYEKGIALFKWPNVYDIWLKYLTQFINRYVSFLIFSFFSYSKKLNLFKLKGGSKLERLRDLFEQCLEGILPKFAKGYLFFSL